MLLSVDNLSVSRGGVSLFEGLNLTLSSGQFISLTGGNGTGKTTLLRSIAGLQPIDEGEILIETDNFIFCWRLEWNKNIIDSIREFTFLECYFWWERV